MGARLKVDVVEEDEGADDPPGAPPDHEELYSASMVVGCRARLRLERGEREEALADILLLRRLGERVEEAQGLQIFY